MFFIFYKRKVLSLLKYRSENKFFKLIAYTCLSIFMGLTMLSRTYAADVLEAENAVLKNAEFDNQIPGFTGTGYVKLSQQWRNKSYIEWAYTVPNTGELKLMFRYLVKKNQRLPLVTVFSVNKSKVIATKRFSTNSGKWEDESFIISAAQNDQLVVRLIVSDQRWFKHLFIDNLSIAPPQFLVRPGNISPRDEPDKFWQPGYANTYYGKVDPQGKRTTFDDWKRANGFDKYKNSVIQAQYINSHDLGFGRDMNCLNNARLSCYVENYLEPKSEKPQFAAVVAMEKMNYKDPITHVSRLITAFFVYGANGERINRITLDSEGAKAIPESCYSCHKGYTDVNGNPQGGQYLPWDINLLEQFPGRPTLAEQAGKFRRLNRMIWHDASIQYDPNDLTQYRKKSLKDLVEGWYGGVPDYGTFYDKDRLPKDEWYTKVPDQNIPAENCATVPLPEVCKVYFKERFLYKSVYAVYCRSCHVSQGDGQDVKKPTDTNSIGLDWDKGMAFWNAAYSTVCSSVNPLSLMPHAELTYNRFATDVINFTDGTSATPKDRLCAEAPPAPKTYGDVLRGTCSGCHSPMGGISPDLSGDNAALRIVLLGDLNSDPPRKVYVIPGNSSNSLIWQRITSTTSPMPPSTSPQLTPEEKSLIQTWIDSGAN